MIFKINFIMKLDINHKNSFAQEKHDGRILLSKVWINKL